MGSPTRLAYFCDALSGARLMPGIIRHGDWILQQRHIPRPNRVLHFGGTLVSKRIGKWLSACRENDYIQVRSRHCHSIPGIKSPT